jgi:hypothetical protein
METYCLRVWTTKAFKQGVCGLPERCLALCLQRSFQALVALLFDNVNTNGSPARHDVMSGNAASAKSGWMTQVYGRMPQLKEGPNLWKSRTWGQGVVWWLQLHYKEGRMSMGKSDTRIVSCIIGLCRLSLWGSSKAVGPIKQLCLRSAAR